MNFTHNLIMTGVKFIILRYRAHTHTLSKRDSMASGMKLTIEFRFILVPLVILEMFV